MSFDLNKLITESNTPLEALLTQSRGLAKKWTKTGLLEGLRNDTEKGTWRSFLRIRHAS